MSEIGNVLPAASSLDAMINKMTAYHTELQAALTDDWRKK